MPTAPKASQPYQQAFKDTIRAVARVTIVLAVLLVAVSYIVGGTKAGHPALIGGLVGCVLVAITGFTMSKGSMKDTQVAFMLGDYLFKVAAMIAASLIVKNITSLDSKPMGLVLLILVIAQAFTQAWSLARAKVPTIIVSEQAKEE